MFIVIPTYKAEHLGNLLKGHKGLRVHHLAGNNDGKRYFPDGERYARVPDVESIDDRIVLLLGFMTLVSNVERMTQLRSSLMVFYLSALKE